MFDCHAFRMFPYTCHHVGRQVSEVFARHSYVLACAYALRAMRQHRARPYQIALLVLTLPHSNSEEERVFSLVTKNKTKFRPNLKPDGTLSSILTIKLANTAPCQDYEPPKKSLSQPGKQLWPIIGHTVAKHSTRG